MRNPLLGILNESSLHSEIKQWYSVMGDQIEVDIDGHVIDIARGNLLIEIQTGHFHSIKNKLIKLLPEHPIRLVYPIATNKWILRYNPDKTEVVSRNKSPKHGRIEDLFTELRYIPSFPSDPNFSLEVLLIEQEDIWINDGKGSRWNRYRSLADRKLLTVRDRRLFSQTSDYCGLLPNGLPGQFTSRDIAMLAHIPSKLAINMIYCLLKLNIITIVGKYGRSRLYSLL